jgi:hypothetical protein
MNWIEDLEDNDVIYCPKCAEAYEDEPIDFEYIDGEKHKITCKCGNTMELVVNRPIVIQLFSEEEI